MNTIIGTILVLASLSAAAYAPQQRVQVGGCWGEAYRKLVCRWIPHCMRQMEKGGQGEELLNFMPGEKFKGCKWSDAYPYNILEASSMALELDSANDPELKAGQDFLRTKIDEWIPIILACQEPSGYIDTYQQRKGLKHFEKDVDHEFYVMGYFLQLGIAHHRATGDRRLLDAAIKCADHLDSIFGPPPKRTWRNGHPGLEMALCQLSDYLHEPRYRALADWMVNHQYTPAQPDSYNQSERPAKDMKDATGHAVRATYFYTAMAMLAGGAGASPVPCTNALAQASLRLFDSIVNRKYYLTGGVGADYRKEAFGPDYELPQDAYAESCAGCGLEYFAAAMRPIGDPDITEAVRERVIYNNILGAIARDGEHFYYQNPLASSKKRTSWHGCPCCVGNIPRVLLRLKDTVYSFDEKECVVYVNQYMDLKGAKVGGYTVDMATDYPASGTVTITTDAPYRFVARWPNRCESKLYKATPEVEHGWRDLSTSSPRTYTFSLPMPEQRVTADPRIASCRGKVAYQRGPIVYSWENGEKVPNYDRLNGEFYSSVWQPESGDNSLVEKPLLGGFHPDPSVCRGPDGVYYLVNSSFMWQPGVPIYSSKDFVNWTFVTNAVPDFDGYNNDRPDWEDGGIWAPTIRYGKGRYWIVFTFHGKRPANYLISADKPEGPWSAPKKINTPDDGGIDPSLFFDDDGKVYLQANRSAKPQKWRGHCVCYIQEIDLDKAQVIGEPVIAAEGVFPSAKNAEGPHLYKNGRDYIFVIAEGGTSMTHAATAYKAKSVLGPYTPVRTNPLVTRRNRGGANGLQCAGHMDLVPAHGRGNFYAVFLGKRQYGPDHRTLLGRETFACPVLWRDGDFICQDERLIEGHLTAPEPPSHVKLPDCEVTLWRVTDPRFDLSFTVPPHAVGTLWLNAKAHLDWPNDSDQPMSLHLVSKDGLTVNGISLDPLVTGAKYSRFNGLGYGWYVRTP